VHTVNKVAVVKRRSAQRLAQKEYQSIMQGGYETLIFYHVHFDAALMANLDQLSSKMEDVDIVMDFLDGLDNGRYAQFKMDYAMAWWQEQ
jgi:hypothetical protein